MKGLYRGKKVDFLGQNLRVSEKISCKDTQSQQVVHHVLEPLRLYVAEEIKGCT